MNSATYTQNRLRQLKGLVTIDPWHEGKPLQGSVALHAYVHFDEARLGGEAGDEISFRLFLRRAEIKLLQTEPKSFEIDPREIWRGDDDITGKIVHSAEERSGSQTLKAASTGIGARTLLSGAVSKAADSAQVRKTEISAEGPVKRIAISFQRTSPDQPTWILRPTTNAPHVEGYQILSGRAWDEGLQRLLTMRVNRRHAATEMLAAIKLLIQCRREDIIFSDIKVRHSDGSYNALSDSSTKRLVVQEYLKDQLIREGLHAGDMNAPFSVVVLGEATSEFRQEHDVAE
ncbi:hypothetical protein SH591_07495 [Sphingomonas sp. LY54]|uniref:hypothetical protein n=1 Tax=Sphingomonas sp. LY54 TaxID=3095343 RepID=UPI002D76D0CD|nr:hypothetical protein [Sphingomonas sp. LY54]WRP30006.1 hypothetical protein SH591_07495 [Sphingomonas sp. LY54]